MPNHYEMVSILYDQYGYLLSQNPTAVSIVVATFIIGVGIGSYVGVSRAMRENEKKK